MEFIPLFELNKEYSSKEVAKKIGIGNSTFQAKRDLYNNHLSLFFRYTTIRKGRGNGLYYIFTHQYSTFIPYKQYNSDIRRKAFQKAIVQTIEKDKRQTGSNIGRILISNEEIIPYNLGLSTITGYVRATLKELIADGYYTLMDPQWCYLDKSRTKYILLTEAEVKELRSYFEGYYYEDQDTAEQAFSDYKEKKITKDEVCAILGEIRLNSFAEGCKKFSKKYQVSWPIKVSAYERCAFYNGKFKDLNKFIIVDKDRIRFEE